MKITTIEVNIVKAVFHLFSVNQAGRFIEMTDEFAHFINRLFSIALRETEKMTSAY